MAKVSDRTATAIDAGLTWGLGCERLGAARESVLQGHRADLSRKLKAKAFL